MVEWVSKKRKKWSNDFSEWNVVLVTHPHYNPFGRVRYDRIGLVGADVCVQCDHQIEVALIRIGFALLSHVVRCSFAEVKSTHCCLWDLVRIQLHSGNGTKNGQWSSELGLIDNLQNRMECLFAAITLRLFHFDQLSRWLGFDTVEVKIKAVDLFDAFRSLDKHWLTDRLDVDCHLKVVLLLAYESFISVAKVKAFVGVDPIVGRRSGEGDRRWSVRDSINGSYNSLRVASHNMENGFCWNSWNRIHW